MWLRNNWPIILVILSLIIYVHAHSHHDGEPAHYKYSKEANQKVNADSKHPHGHSHDHHGHSHDHHGHSHDHHGHTHDQHGHSHDQHGHSHDQHGHSHDQHGHSHDQHGHSHDHHGHDHLHSTKEQESVKSKVKSPIGSMVWVDAILATLLVSAAPVIILFLVPFDNSKENEQKLKLGLSFASGGLLGDAFLHLIPHAIDPHDHTVGESHSHSHSHDAMHSHSHHLQVGLCVLGGIMTFLIVEKFVHYVKGHSHSHSHGASVTTDGTNDHVKGDKVDKKSKKNAKKAKKDIAVSGYLNLAADFAHNFTDGLTIGASFLVGRPVGIVTTVAILIHEVPHEIGDFAILIQAGMSKRKAMMVQLVTAIGAMLGTLTSLLAEGIGNVATHWILPFTAGGFIYIATVSVLPQLLEDSKPWQSFLEIFCLLLGVFLMVGIAAIE